MIVKLIFQLTLSFIIIQILNCTFDELILNGIAQLYKKSSSNKLEESNEAKANLKHNKLKEFISTKLNSKILPNFDSISLYATGLLQICIGALITVYLVCVLFNTWRLVYQTNQKESLLKMSNIYVLIFLVVSIPLDLAILAYFLNSSNKVFANFENAKFNFERFRESIYKQKFDLFKNSTSHSAIHQNFFDLLFDNKQAEKIQVESVENFNLINQSMAKIQTNLYVKYLNLKLCVIYSFALAVLTFIFLIFQAF